MIIVVADGVDHEFPAATRFSTEDRFNNLCIWENDDRLVAVFADGRWEQVHGQSGD